MFKRLITHKLDEVLADTPVTLITGPRQSGKTTLVKSLVLPSEQPFSYVTLDDESDRDYAINDPIGFIRRYDRLIIDEIQRAPNLLLAIKKSVDEDRRPGRFVLTSSANVLTMPSFADSLAGRMENLTLLPLSQAELSANTTNWLDAVFAGDIPPPNPKDIGETLISKILTGGYPEVVARTSEKRQQDWCLQYVNALLTRDILDVAAISKTAQLPKLLSIVAQMAGNLSNAAKVAGEIGIDRKTAAKYMHLLEQMYLIREIPSWSTNEISRVVKSAKIHFIDSAILATLLGQNKATLLRDRSGMGALTESFVLSELLKMASYSPAHYRFTHYRDAAKNEVDIIVENTRSQLVAIEVKASATLGMSDLKGIKYFQSIVGDSLVAGIILYDGSEIKPMGEKIWAVPLSSLW